MVGTPYYLSPELCEGRGYNVKVIVIKSCYEKKVKSEPYHRAIYGPSDASSMKWQQAGALSKRQTKVRR